MYLEMNYRKKICGVANWGVLLGGILKYSLFYLNLINIFSFAGWMLGGCWDDARVKIQILPLVSG